MKNQVVLLVVYPKDTASFKDDLMSEILVTFDVNTCWQTPVGVNP